MRRASYLLLIALAVLLAGCLVGPNYQRPALVTPPGYRGPDNLTTPAAAESFADAKWWTVFQDPVLQKLIRTALQQNLDLRLAASRVIQARAQVMVTRANQFPTASGTATSTGERQPQVGIFPTYTYNAGEVAASASWDLDFWGKYRRATEAARASLLADSWAQQEVIRMLVANVASAYFELRDLDLQLEISQRTLTSRQDSLNITTTLVNGGNSPLTDQRQAEQLVETAAANIPDLQRQIQQQENAIHILLGDYPGPIERGQPLTEQPLPMSVPAGLPSALLERRPDIREAEQNMISANANIGVAKAAYYPDISLTALFGFESGSLVTLFNGGSHAWSYTGTATQPLFQAGRLKGNVQIAEAEKQQALLTYQQTIQGAFRDVSNALIAYQKYHEYRGHLERLTEAAKSASDLSHMRYSGGVISYLEVLTNETNYYSAELSLATAQLNERLSLVQMYEALGGGWEQ